MTCRIAAAAESLRFAACAAFDWSFSDCARLNVAVWVSLYAAGRVIPYIAAICFRFAYCAASSLGTAGPVSVAVWSSYEAGPCGGGGGGPFGGGVPFTMSPATPKNDETASRH